MLAFSLVIAKNGTNNAQLFGFGYNQNYQLGLGDGDNRFVPSVLNIANVASVFAGRLCSFAITSSGQIYGWGSNAFGEIGNGNAYARQTPGLLSLSDIVQITSASHTLFVNSSGSLFGTGVKGRLGFDDAVARNVPTYNPNLSDSIVSLASGESHSLILDSKGRIYTFGSNYGGALGIGSDTISEVLLPTYIRDM